METLSSIWPMILVVLCIVNSNIYGYIISLNYDLIEEDKISFKKAFFVELFRANIFKDFKNRNIFGKIISVLGIFLLFSVIFISVLYAVASDLAKSIYKYFSKRISRNLN